jgi:hypothetical protein
MLIVIDISTIMDEIDPNFKKGGTTFSIKVLGKLEYD